MATTLYVLRTLVLALWVGSIAFFAFGVAPVAFHVLPSSHEAGLVVAGSLHVLHETGLGYGAAFLLCSVLALIGRSRPQNLLLPACLVLCMLGLTAYSARIIIPRMERDRLAAGGSIDSVPTSSPARLDFDHLHHLSEQVEGGVLLLGLLAITLTLARGSRTTSIAAPARFTER